MGVKIKATGDPKLNDSPIICYCYIKQFYCYWSGEELSGR